MQAIGIDIGGTKIDLAIFGADWETVESNRIPTPASYRALCDVIASSVADARERCGATLPVGIASAGRSQPATGRFVAANLAAHGAQFEADLKDRLGGTVVLMNDGQAFAMAEAVHGAGKGHRTVAALVFGTGLGGGAVVDGKLVGGTTGTGGEIGQMTAAADVVARYDLPLFANPLGPDGCYEAYLSGPGLVRLAKHFGHVVGSAEEVMMACPDVVAAWAEMTGALVLATTYMLDPDIIVLGGGLSETKGVADILAKAAQARQLPEFTVPPIVTGSQTPALGAAIAAWQLEESESDV